MTIFLTGAAGFIGFKTAEKLLESGALVVGIDNLNDYYDVSLKKYRLEQLQKHDAFTFYEGDIEDLKALSNIFDNHKIDSVINLAARAGVRYSMENPHIYMTTNAHGTLNLLECMRKNDIKKMVLASTSSLYAGLTMPFSEDLPVNTPISPYAASKKAAEVMAYSYHHLYKFDISIVRYFTVFGPAGRPDMSPFRILQSIQENKSFTLFGDGSQSRDFTYVDDIAEGTIAGLQEVGYEVFNLGGGNNPISLKKIIEWSEDLMGGKLNIIQKEWHKADMMETWASIEKAKKILGWEPKVSVRDGFKMTANWHKENKDFLADISI